MTHLRIAVIGKWLKDATSANLRIHHICFCRLLQERDYHPFADSCPVTCLKHAPMANSQISMWLVVYVCVCLSWRMASGSPSFCFRFVFGQGLPCFVFFVICVCRVSAMYLKYWCSRTQQFTEKVTNHTKQYICLLSCYSRHWGSEVAFSRHWGFAFASLGSLATLPVPRF